MVNSIPKGGTNLLLRLVGLLGFSEARPRFWIGADLIHTGNGISSFLRMLSRMPHRRSVLIGSGVSWLAKRLDKVAVGSAFGAHYFYTEKLVGVVRDRPPSYPTRDDARMGTKTGYLRVMQIILNATNRAV